MEGIDVKVKWELLENWLNQETTNPTIIVREPLSKLKTKKFIKWENVSDKNMTESRAFVAVKIKKSKLMAFAVNSHFFFNSTVCQLADDGYKYNKFLGVFWHYILVSDIAYEVNAFLSTCSNNLIQSLAKRY